MAGKRISREYAARIRDYGIAKIFERVENGETIKDIAASLGMSRGWLSTYLNQDLFAAEDLALCRAVAAHRRLAACSETGRQHEVREYVENGPALYLEALRRVGRGEATAGARTPAAGTQTGLASLLARPPGLRDLLRARGLVNPAPPSCAEP